MPPPVAPHHSACRNETHKTRARQRASGLYNTPGGLSSKGPAATRVARTPVGTDLFHSSARGSRLPANRVGWGSRQGAPRPPPAIGSQGRSRRDVVRTSYLGSSF